MATILVTGGCGFIGSHTIVDLLENGYDVISIDDNSRSTDIAIAGIEKITGKKIKNYLVDLKNYDETRAVFQENENIAGIIHFAAYKAVGESVEQPILYYENNLFGLINLLKCVTEFNVPNFVFHRLVLYMAILTQFQLQNNHQLKKLRALMELQNKWAKE